MLPSSRDDNAEYPLYVNVEDGSITMERIRMCSGSTMRAPRRTPPRIAAPGGNPHDTTLRRICTGTTDESLVCVFDDTPLTTTLWTSFGHPCELPYIPLHPLAGIPTEIDQMEDAALEMANHLKPDAEKALYENSGWSKFKDFQMKVDLTYTDTHAALETLRDSLIASMKQSNAEAIAAAKKEPSKAAEILADAGQKATTDYTGCVGEIRRREH